MHLIHHYGERGSIFLSLTVRPSMSEPVSGENGTRGYTPMHRTPDWMPREKQWRKGSDLGHEKLWTKDITQGVMRDGNWSEGWSLPCSLRWSGGCMPYKRGHRKRCNKTAARPRWGTEACSLSGDSRAKRQHILHKELWENTRARPTPLKNMIPQRLCSVIQWQHRY